MSESRRDRSLYCRKQERGRNKLCSDWMLYKYRWIHLKLKNTGFIHGTDLHTRRSAETRYVIISKVNILDLIKWKNFHGPGNMDVSLIMFWSWIPSSMWPHFIKLRGTYEHRDDKSIVSDFTGINVWILIKNILWRGGEDLDKWAYFVSTILSR